MMKRLLSFVLAVSLTMSIVSMAPMANATYTQDELSVSLAAPVAVEVTNSYLNVRKGPGTAYEAVAQLKQGDKVTITETQKVGSALWGKYEGGWISLKYTNYDEASKAPQTPVVSVSKTFATVINTDTLNIRDVPDGKTVGSLKKGEKVEILERKTVSGREWGRCDKGWICLRSYVKLETVTVDVPQEPELSVAVKVEVVGNDVNVRVGPGVNYDKAGMVQKGELLTIVETKQADGYLWGKFDGGWVALKYTDYDTVIQQQPQTQEKTYATVINTDTLNIRDVPDGKTVGALKKGEKVEILERKTVSGREWGRCDKGWICLRSYVKLETVTAETPSQPQAPSGAQVEVTADDVNIRKGPGLSYGKNGKLNKGDKLTITEVKEADDLLWGKFDGGWISLKYTTVTDKMLVEKTYATVINTDTLNIRDVPDGKTVDALKKGDKVEILERKTVSGREWGRCDKGWICLRSYVKLETALQVVQPDVPDTPQQPETPEEPKPGDLKTSENGLNFIKNMEGFSAKPYVDTDGHYTIGYGTWCPSDKVSYYNKYPMSKEKADMELRKSVKAFEAEVDAFLAKHNVTFTQQQYDAVISLVFNCGTTWLNTGTTLINALTEGVDDNTLLYAFSIYSMSGSKRSLGHVKRRLLEANVYLYGEYTATLPDKIGYVIYEPCGGKISAGNGTYNVQGFQTEKTAALAATASREGYIFKGWFTQETGGKQVTVLDRSMRNVVLYAQWIRDPNAGPDTPPDQPQTPEKPQIPPLPDNHGYVVPEGTVTVEPVQVKVTSDGVNIRKGPGTSHERVMIAYATNTLYIYATYQATNYLWGLSENGWVALHYTNYNYVIKGEAVVPEVPEGYKLVTTVYATVMYSDTLNVRDYPDGESVRKLSRGDRAQIQYTVTLTNGELWGCIGDGFISLNSNVELENQYSVVPESGEPTILVEKTYVKINGILVLQVYDAPDGKIVSVVLNGKRTELLEKTTVDGNTWVRIGEGWLLQNQYVLLETVMEEVKI